MPRCEASVASNGFGYRPLQCSREGSVERDGKWYCKQHDPEAVAERKRQLSEVLRQKWSEEARLRREANAKQAEIERKAALADELAAALLAILEEVDGPNEYHISPGLFSKGWIALQKWERR
jgi:hypothetical protein